MESAQEKFQGLLRELFQFDCAELDFGIYRVMNYKRDVIEKFIAEGLPKAISDELEKGILADQAQAARELKEVAGQIKELLGHDVLDPKGNLAEAFHNTPLGRKYQGLRIRVGIWRDREALEAAIFNHLYAFFSRYYQDGDFISKHRYTRRQRYAIPYNGEEVYLYCHDQYYVKTGEYFQDYTFKARLAIFLMTMIISSFMPKMLSIGNRNSCRAQTKWRPATPMWTTTRGVHGSQGIFRLAIPTVRDVTRLSALQVASFPARRLAPTGVIRKRTSRPWIKIVVYGGVKMGITFR